MLIELPLCNIDRYCLQCAYRPTVRSLPVFDSFTGARSSPVILLFYGNPKLPYDLG